MNTNRERYEFPELAKKLNTTGKGTSSTRATLTSCQMYARPEGAVTTRTRAPLQACRLAFLNAHSALRTTRLQSQTGRARVPEVAENSRSRGIPWKRGASAPRKWLEIGGSFSSRCGELSARKSFAASSGTPALPGLLFATDFFRSLLESCQPYTHRVRLQPMPANASPGRRNRIQAGCEQEPSRCKRD